VPNSTLQQLCARCWLNRLCVHQALRKVLAGSRPMDLPQLLRPMAPAERAAWLSLHDVPSLMQARHTMVCLAVQALHDMHEAECLGLYA